MKKIGSILTYEEIVAALRKGRQLGDCVPEDAARAIVAGRSRPPIHVVVRDEQGNVLDPSKKPVE